MKSRLIQPASTRNRSLLALFIIVLGLGGFALYDYFLRVRRDQVPQALCSDTAPQAIDDAKLNQLTKLPQGTAMTEVEKLVAVPRWCTLAAIKVNNSNEASTVVFNSVQGPITLLFEKDLLVGNSQWTPQFKSGDSGDFLKLSKPEPGLPAQGTTIGNFPVISGIGDFAISGRIEFRVPFAGRIELADNCPVFISKRIPGYVVRFCQVENADTGDKLKGDFLARASKLAVITVLWRGKDGIFRPVIPSTDFLGSFFVSGSQPSK